ncbi:MAG: LTA synthase family protein [Rikenellaceae bacterium]|nr:LTA synthase family protein [Rikenellaceae bacterium]
MTRKILLIVATFLTSLVLMALQKPMFLIWYAEQSAEASAAELMGVSLHGALLDSTMAGYISVIPWLLMLAAVWITIPERVMQRILNGYFATMAFLISLIVAVDMGLFRYWGYRIDSTIFPYLATPKEAAASVTWGDLIPAVTLFFAYGAVMLLAWLPISRIYRAAKQSLKQRITSSLVLLFIGGLLFLAIRGGLSPATANVSKVYFSDNMFLNHAATNPVFSLLSSSMRSELKADDYHYFAEEELQEILSELAPSEGIAQRDTLLTTQRPNIVLVVLEGFGRTTATTTFEGRAVTPQLDRMRSEGIWFENMFANSYRTDRGTVAVMSGHPAHPIASIMKYPQKAHTLPAIASSLKAEGYSTSFTYGGDANFTNTASYLYGTGIEKITDQKSLHLDVPISKWGYADDVVCDYFADEVLRLSQEGKPFFASLLTLSSHEPFEVPYDAFEDKVLNATAFADHHVGEMIERWRNTPAWENMLVILIADHGISYPEGIEIGSLPRQRIPMLWMGGAVKVPLEVSTYSSQCDLAATLLGQLNIDHSRFNFSKDIFDPASPHYAYWSYNNGFGIISDKGNVVYSCTGDKITSYAGTDAATESLTRAGKALTQSIHQDICNR